MIGEFRNLSISAYLRVASLLAIACIASSVDAAADPAPGASQSVQVAVPDRNLATAPFDVTRTLSIPPGFSISVFARVEGVRFMAIAPNGDLLVSNPDAGSVTLLRQNSGAIPRSLIFANGLHRPHDLVFHTEGDKTYLYIAESNRIMRTPYSNGQTRIGTMEVVVNNLPDASSNGLKGSYGHQLKNIALNAGKLYVSIASTCNACSADVKSDPIRYETQYMSTMREVAIASCTHEDCAMRKDWRSNLERTSFGPSSIIVTTLRIRITRIGTATARKTSAR